MSDFASLLKLVMSGGQPVGTAAEPYNPAARLASGVPMSGFSLPGMGGPAPAAPVNPSQFGSIPGLPTSIGSGQASPAPGFGTKALNSVIPQTMAGKGGASGG